jgi:hypothetical protein
MMDKEMEKDGSVEQYEQMQQQQQGGMQQEQEPVDNVSEKDDTKESQTPQLDADVEKYSGINKR